ncbi:unnamed protein product, partial [Mesorhabditis spiculigera]
MTKSAKKKPVTEKTEAVASIKPVEKKQKTKKNKLPEADPDAPTKALLHPDVLAVFEEKYKRFTNVQFTLKLTGFYFARIM